MLTPSQERALDITRNLSVTANAGSGKTLVLVKRFVKILLERPDIAPENIVAITFTDKAAGELHGKIVKEIDDLLAQTPGDEHLRELRAGIHAAFIGTIHSFCKRLLQEYPLEANVDAEFTQLDSNEQYLLIEEAMTERFRSALDAEDSMYAEYRSLFLKLGRDAVANITRLLIQKRDMWRALEKFYGQTDDAILKNWNVYIKLEKEKLVGNSVVGEIEALLLDNRQKKAGEARQVLDLYRDAASIEEKFDVLCMLLEGITTAKGELNAWLIGGSENRGEYTRLGVDVKKLKDECAVYASTLTSEEREKQLRDAVVMSKTIWSLAKEVGERYERKKENIGALDFDDLQLRAVELLREPTIRRELQEQYRYIMVDEFQDTNRLQYELVELLTEQHTRGNLFGNLFIVGDPKQSIYAFRNAEVEVFHQAKEDIVNAPNGGSELLSESFRMLPAIADFVNAVFPLMMAHDAIAYDPLIATPVRENAEVEKSAGYVECVFPEEPETNDDENGDEESADAVGEEEHIARRILELVNANTGNVSVYDSAGKRAPTYADIAILLRSRASNLPKLEAALHAHKIPFIVTGGIGFYGRQEIRDITSYLRFLLNEKDDVALLGILRSPFFTISDVELFAAAVETREKKELHTFWERVCAYAKSETVSQTLQNAVARLKADIDISQRISLTELLYRITVETGWIGSIAGNPLAAQARANAEKLTAIARNYEQRGFTSLFDFVEYLGSLADAADKEGQAAVESDGNVVRIMTVHAAKGLEFPIVFLPFLGGKIEHKGRNFFDTEMGFAFPSGDEEESAAYRLMRDRAIRREEEEERRIFYVACTRARDALFLSGTGAKSNSWIGWLKNALQETNAQVNIRKTLPEIAIPAKAKSEIIAREPATIAVNEIQSESHGEFFSASHFVTHAQCPMKYVLRYLLGAPERFAPRRSAERDGDDRIYGTERGTIAHAVLARMDAHGSQASDVETLRQMTEREAENIDLDEAHRMQYADEVTALLQKAAKSDVWRMIFSSETVFCEYEISAALGEHFIHGVIDRLYRDKDNVWHIVDYKTNRVNKSSVDELVKNYSIQLDVYAWLVLALHPETPRVISHLFFLEDPSLSMEKITKRDDITTLQARLEKWLLDIAMLQKHPKNAIKNKDHCNECGFFIENQCLSE